MTDVEWIIGAMYMFCWGVIIYGGFTSNLYLILCGFLAGYLIYIDSLTEKKK